MASRNPVVGHYRLHGRFDKTCFYVVDGFLIDCGGPRMRKSFEHILGNRNIEQAALSHYHEQHSGNADLLNEKGIVPYLSPWGIQQLKNGFPPRLLYRRLTYGTPGAARFQPMPREIKTPRFTFQVIPAPGHSPDHVCFYEPNEGWLFAGDLYHGSLFKYCGREENIYALIRSYEILRELPVKVMYCSHIGSITDPRYLLENKWFSLTSMRDTVMPLKNRRRSLAEIRRAMRFREGWRALLTQGDKSKANFILSILHDEPS